MKQDKIHKFVGDQLSCWPLACRNFRALKNVSVREMEIGGLKVRLQHNPARMISSAAKLSKEEIASRKCFLCRENRPDEQMLMKFEGRKGKKYHILVNPYPIFPDHIVIAMNRHVDQSIWHRYVDMLDLARKYSRFVFFYNGPKSGASAPDHHHFQAAPKGLFPLVEDVDAALDCGRDGSACGHLQYLTSVQDAQLFHYDRFTTGVFVLRAETSKSMAKLFYRLLDCADIPLGETEPMFNLFTYWTGSEYRSTVVFRSRHRSHHYFSDGPDHLTMSPGCADMGGVFIVPVAEDYDKLTPGLLGEMVSEVSVSTQEQEKIKERLTRKQPLLQVGIMSAPELVFEILSDGAGPRKASVREGKIEYGGALYDELYFGSKTLSTMFAEPSFILYGVTIGVGFHWQRQEDQKFAGALKVIVADGKLTAINVIGVEDYLLSVISSEMSATSSEEFLKAHAVISRSWVMAQLNRAVRCDRPSVPDYVGNTPALVSWLDSMGHGGQEQGTEHIRWYDHEDHKRFDVCADDHCQRYQGLTRATGETVRKAIDATWGQVLTCEGELCDARFSKCCGGVMERFSSCWEDKDHPYLQALPDSPGHSVSEKCFCDTDDQEILSQVLNNYDRETQDFFRWNVEYSREELSGLICSRSGLDLGRLISLEPLERGGSGRIIRLRITGDEGTVVVGKELEIRKWLSDSHLKSSAFDVKYLDAERGECSSDEDWKYIVIEGLGWGHGVGLCQIGAAVMAERGYSYREILLHYYPGTDLSQIGNNE